MRKVMAVRSSYTRGHCKFLIPPFHIVQNLYGEVYIAMKFDPTRDNLVSMRDETAHTKLRAKMAAGVGQRHSSLYITC